VSDKIYGGLSFSSQDVGEVFAVTGTQVIWCRSYCGNISIVYFCIKTPQL